MESKIQKNTFSENFGKMKSKMPVKELLKKIRKEGWNK